MLETADCLPDRSEGGKTVDCLSVRSAAETEITRPKNP